MGVEKNVPKTLMYVRIHYSSDQLPGRHAAEPHPHSPLSLPELPDAQAAGILSIPKRTHGKERQRLARRAQPGRLDIHEPRIPAPAGIAAADVIEGEVVLLAAVDAVDCEDEDGRCTPLGVSVQRPVRTLKFKGESDDSSQAWLQNLTPRRDGPSTNTVIRPCVGEDGGWFDSAGPAVRVDPDVLFPFDVPAFREKEHIFASGEMLDAEFFIAHGKVPRFKPLHIGLSGALDVTGAPACVDEFPFAVVDADSVPGVAGVVGWKDSSRFQRGVPVALSVAADDNAFEAGVGGQGCEQGSIAFTDC
jgi:hypothetical protein